MQECLQGSVANRHTCVSLTDFSVWKWEDWSCLLFEPKRTLLQMCVFSCLVAILILVPWEKMLVTLQVEMRCSEDQLLWYCRGQREKAGHLLFP